MRPDVRFVNDLQEFCCHFRSQRSLHHQPRWQRTDWLDQPGHECKVSCFLECCATFCFLGRTLAVKKKDSLNNWRRRREGDCTMLKITNRNSFLGIYGYQWNIRSQSQNDFIHTWGQMWDLWMIYKNSVATSWGHSQACAISPFGKGRIDLTNLAMTFFLECCANFCFLEGGCPWRKRTASTIEEDSGDCQVLKITNTNVLLGTWKIWDSSKNHHEVIPEISNLDTMRRWNLPTWGPKPCCACASIGVFETCQGLLGWISCLICQGLPGLEKDSFNICHCNHPHLLITEPGWFKGESFATKSMAKHLLLIGQSRKDWTNQSNDSNQEKINIRSQFSIWNFIFSLPL